jgi:hypothetical protein
MLISLIGNYANICEGHYQKNGIFFLVEELMIEFFGLSSFLVIAWPLLEYETLQVLYNTCLIPRLKQ